MNAVISPHNVPVYGCRDGFWILFGMAVPTLFDLFWNVFSILAFPCFWGSFAHCVTRAVPLYCRLSIVLASLDFLLQLGGEQSR